MSFLRRFWKRLLSFLPNNSELSPSSTLARYLTSSGWFAKKENRVKPRAFLPAPNGQLSVFQLDEKSGSREVALKYVHPLRSNVNIHGHAANRVKDFREAKLSLIRAEPPPKHFNVEGWPESKDEQMFIAQELAEKSNLFLFDSKIEMIK